MAKQKRLASSSTSTSSSKDRPVRQNRPATGKKGAVRGGPTIRKKSRSSLYLVLGTLAAVLVVIVGFVMLERWQTSQATAGYGQPEAIDSTVFEEVTGVPAFVWKAVGAGGITQPFTTISGLTPLKGSNGLPEVFYIGGEFCPSCAAERWAMLNAFSRFGTFKNITQIHSFEDGIATFSFSGGSYTSSYIDFVPREINGNTADSTGKYMKLDTLTSDQQQLYSQQDSGGSIPFIDVGNTYKLIGSSYQYSVLQDGSGNALSWQDIASSLGQSNSPISRNILGTANYLTAAICQVDGQKPATVCQTSAIEQIESSLGSRPTSSLPARRALAETVPPVALLETQRRRALPWI